MLAGGAAHFGTGCKKGEDPQKNPPQKTGSTTEQQAGSNDLNCTDTSGLSDSDKKTRKQLQCVDHADKLNKTCANCQLYQPPEDEGGCGGCQTVPGPINPDGYCTAWVEKS